MESDFKRLVSNAKETNTRQSEAFSDAERVRKAVSNLMVKQNPAYKSGNYQAVATPLPSSPAPDGAEDEEENEEEDAEGEEDVGSDTGAKAEDDEEDEAEGEEEDGEEEGEEGEEEEEGEGAEHGEDEEDEDEGEEADDGDDEDPKPRRIIRRGRGRRRGPAPGRAAPVRSAPGRSARGSVASTQKSTRKATPSAAKAKTHSEETGYKGLTFQQAQEKIVEDTIKMSDEA